MHINRVLSVTLSIAGVLAWSNPSMARSPLSDAIDVCERAFQSRVAACVEFHAEGSPALMNCGEYAASTFRQCVAAAWAEHMDVIIE
jgi:hypothetical protein